MERVNTKAMNQSVTAYTILKQSKYVLLILIYRGVNNKISENQPLNGTTE